MHFSLFFVIYDYYRITKGRKMERGRIFTLQKNRVTVFVLLWLAFCLIGVLAFHLFDFLQCEAPILAPKVLPKIHASSFLQKEFWSFLIASVKQEMFFILLLAFSTTLNVGIYMARFSFAVRGFLFGLGGSLLLLRAPFPLFLAVVLRQIFLTVTHLFFAAILYEKSNIGNDPPNRKSAFVLFYSVFDAGVSLLVQFLFVFLWVKN